MDPTGHLRGGGPDLWTPSAICAAAKERTNQPTNQPTNELAVNVFVLQPLRIS